MIPVHLRAGGDEDRLLEAGAVLEYVLSALNVRK